MKMIKSFVDMHKVGVLWDMYTPQVEAQLTRDLIALQANIGAELAVITDRHEADAVLKALLIPRLPMESVATTWILYRTSDTLLQAPEHAEDVIERDLSVSEGSGKLSLTPREGHYLKPQGRGFNNSSGLFRAPPHGMGSIDPNLSMIWSSLSRK